MATTYNEPLIKITRGIPTDNTTQITQANVIPLLMGPSLGKLITVSNEAITRGATLYDDLDYDNVESILSVGDEEGIANYIGDTDYQINDASPVDQIQWLNNTSSPPSLGASSDYASGTVPADTYYGVITGTNSFGETIKSDEVSIDLVDTGSILWSWDGVCEHLTGFKLYVSTVSGNYTDKLLKTIATKGTRLYTWDGSDTPGAGSPPGANTAYRKPIEAATYYTSYRYRDYTYRTVLKKFLDLGDVYTDHDKTSAIGRAAEIIMAPPPKGNNCSEIYAIGIDPDDIATGELTAYETALVEAEKITEVVRVIPLSYHDAVNLAVVRHCQRLTYAEEMKPRICEIGGSADVYGPVGEVGSVMYKIDALGPNQEGGELINYTANGATSYRTVSDAGASTYVDTDSWPLRVSHAGARGALRDPSSGLTESSISGYIRLRNVGLDYNSKAERKYVGGVGALVYKYKNTPDEFGNGVIKLIQDQTVYTISAYYNETPIVEIDLLLAKFIHDTLYNHGHLGKKLTTARKFSIRKDIEDCMDAFRIKDWLSRPGKVIIKPYEEDPYRKVYCRYSYLPYFQLLGIYIDRHFIYST